MWTSSDDSSICITTCSDCDRTSFHSVLDLQELIHCVLEEKTCNLTLIMRKWKYRSLPDIITCGYRFIKRNGWCNMKPCSRRLLISCDLNQNELVQTWISEACFGDLTQCANDWHVIFMLFFCMLCWESVYIFIFFVQTTVHLPRNNKNT